MRLGPSSHRAASETTRSRPEPDRPKSTKPPGRPAFPAHPSAPVAGTLHPRVSAQAPAPSSTAMWSAAGVALALPAWRSHRPLLLGHLRHLAHHHRPPPKRDSRIKNDPGARSLAQLPGPGLHAVCDRPGAGPLVRRSGQRLRSAPGRWGHLGHQPEAAAVPIRRLNQRQTTRGRLR
jgi:hypothetical protein